MHHSASPVVLILKKVALYPLLFGSTLVIHITQSASIEMHLFFLIIGILHEIFIK